MSTVEVTGLHVLGVFVTDMARSEAFYRDHLGFQRTTDVPPGILMTAGDVTIYLEESREDTRKTGSTTTEFSPCLATASVKKSYQALKEAGVRILSDYQEFDPSFAFFRIADPDGNMIEFAGTP